jgi:light-harvesting protein B-800-850 beta chain
MLPPEGDGAMNYDPDKVWPSGLTIGEAEELHRHIIDGTRVFGFIAVLAHILAYVYSPWFG